MRILPKVVIHVKKAMQSLNLANIFLDFKV
jgi:hypothetical protein